MDRTWDLLKAGDDAFETIWEVSDKWRAGRKPEWRVLRSKSGGMQSEGGSKRKKITESQTVMLRSDTGSGDAKVLYQPGDLAVLEITAEGDAVEWAEFLVEELQDLRYID